MGDRTSPPIGNLEIPMEQFSGDPVSGTPDGEDIQPTKRLNPTRDRLSELPDLALVHIISYLYVEEAVRTTILSKRFNSLWRSASFLNFSDEHCDKNGYLFINFVNTALGFHRRCEVEKFSVKFWYTFMYKKAVDDWLKFAVKKQVKLLHLDFIQNRRHFERFEHELSENYCMNGKFLEYELPEFVYMNEKLVEFVIRCCKFSTKGEISWSSLKLLSITQAKVNEGLISKILSGCPVLDTLELRNWSGCNQLKINSVSLRVLRIIGEQDPESLIKPHDDRLLEISCPNLTSLEVLGLLYRTEVRVNDFRSLVNATMDFEIRPEITGTSFSARNQDIVREVLESLYHVKALTVGGWCIRALSTYETFNLSSPWSKLRSLTLFVPVMKWDYHVHGMTNLFSSLPYLETLVIRLSYSSNVYSLKDFFAFYHYRDNEYYGYLWSSVTKCPLLQLKTVKVVGFRLPCGRSYSIFHFLKFLLKKSRALEKIVIQASQNVGRNALDEARKLLSAPKSSPDDVVLFEPPHFWVDRVDV